MMQLIRNHWEVENKLHWSLNVSFNEDNSRVRTGHVPENLALIRKIALNLLRQNKTKKCGAKIPFCLCATFLAGNIKFMTLRLPWGESNLLLL
jgi:hypothetical protein